MGQDINKLKAEWRVPDHGAYLGSSYLGSKLPGQALSYVSPCSPQENKKHGVLIMIEMFGHQGHEANFHIVNLRRLDPSARSQTSEGCPIDLKMVCPSETHGEVQLTLRA